MPKQKRVKKYSKKVAKKVRSSVRKPVVKLLRYIRKNADGTKLLFFVGIILILISGIYHLYEITKYSFTTPPPVIQTVKQLPHPTYITIEGTSMSFPVYETVIQHGVWQIADDGASHLDISANPGENGTIIIYGHNTLIRFGSLPYVFQGQTVNLMTADNKIHSYIIQKTQVVDPTDTKVLTSQKGEVLIIYTCYGFADLQRFVVFAYPKPTQIEPQ